MTLATLALLALFVGLGRWQWDRGEARAAQWREFEEAPPPVLIENSPREFDRLPRFSWVAFYCRFDGAHQFLLENRSHAGRPGYEVLTPCTSTDGRRILVNRGWIPFEGHRDRLPDISLKGDPDTKVHGRIDELPTPGLASGRAPPDATQGWPVVTTFPSHEELQSALGAPIARRIVLMDPWVKSHAVLPGPQEPDDGYVREWSPPGLAPARHFSYAIQWWGFAVVLLVLYFGLNFRKVK
jgi:cytochrome oxidase assembly protein ShyY1